MTVDDVIGYAREEHRAFTRRDSPDRVVRRFLTRWQRTLLARLADDDPSALDSVQQITMPISPWDSGEALNDHILVHGGDVVFDDSDLDDERLEIVAFADRADRYRYRWGAYVLDGTLYFLGRSDDWDDVARVDVHLFPQGTELTAGSTAFDLPGQALNVAVAAAASFMAKRSEAVDPAPYLAELQLAENRYLDEVAGRRRAHIGVTREAW